MCVVTENTFNIKNSVLLIYIEPFGAIFAHFVAWFFASCMRVDRVKGTGMNARSGT